MARALPAAPVTDATLASDTWKVNVWSGDAGEVATGTVDDVTGEVLDAWTGPQVAWGMARGDKGAFGGKEINTYKVWLGFCAVFLLGLVDWRRILSLRNVDLLALLSFSVALWFFNRGHVFAAMPLVYPGLLWLLARSLWIGRSDRRLARPRRLAGLADRRAAVFLAGFRVMLNVRSSNVIDVGYAGVIGADRITRGQSPYGNFPVEGNRPKCGPADSSGEVRDRVQTNGRCENANPNGDTYGPVSYLAYLPGFWIFGWTGQWDSLPAAHATTILWDLLAIVGLALVGWRLGGPKDGPRLAAILAFAWVAWPFTHVRVGLEHERPDRAGAPDLGLPVRELARAARRVPRARLVGEVRAAPARAAVERLPRDTASPAAARLLRRVPDRHRARVLACCCSTGRSGTRRASSGIARSRRRSTASRRSRSGTGGSTTRVDCRTCTPCRSPCEVLLVVGALALWRWPRRRSPLQLAAFTAAVLIGFEIVLTHWFFLYLPWFFPFVAIALPVGAPAAGAGRGAGR